jgi:glycosyltransferase involved in cell wall biosynthesis
MLDVSVVVPVRNAAGLVEHCLASIARAEPRELIVVDGNSTDHTLDLARRYTDCVLSDGGRGLPAARLMGAQAATSKRIALVDADVVLPDGSLAALLEEFERDGYTALQAGLHSIAGGEYWGEALANHHRTGRSKNWFGLVATVFEREELLRLGFDDRFASGEDIELRWRLEQSGHKIGVSKRTVVEHRFESGWSFARGQWRMDGQGLAGMVAKHGLRGAVLLAMPLAAGVRGILLSVVRLQLKWIPYYVCYSWFNYTAMLGGLLRGRRRPAVAQSHTTWYAER